MSAEGPRAPQGRLRLDLHAAALAVAALVVHGARVGGLVALAALTGGCYACALVLALRPRLRLRRALGFIATAAALNAATVPIALRLLPGAQRVLPAGPTAQAAVLALVAAAGAAAFGVLLRQVAWPWLDAPRIARLAATCALATATVAVLAPGAGPHALWRLSLGWWLACSGTLGGYAASAPPGR